MHMMCSTESPREKRRKVEHVDKMSNLPDSILNLILSFLTTKEAVHTSLLAKRYRYLWASVPVLDFNFADFLPSDEISDELEEGEEDLDEYEEKFVKFVDGVLEHREPLNLDSFKLVWDEEDSDPTPANTWLDTVAKLKPKFLYVHIFTENYNFVVPDSIFLCESLQELFLHLGFETISPRAVHLPCLKRITLDSIELEDEVMKKLLSGLPVLEEMVLCYCQLHICDISSGTLKRLVLDSYHNEKTPPEILISTPCLVYLEVNSWAMGRINFKKMESIVKAHIHFEEFSDEEPVFLTGLSNVTHLDLVLSGWDLMRMKDVLKNEETKFPTFKNLKTLTIGKWCMTRDFDLVASFLFHAPHLEKLTLLHCKSLTDGDSTEINLELVDSGDIVEINSQKNDRSVSEVVKGALAHWKTIREINSIFRLEVIC